MSYILDALKKSEQERAIGANSKQHQQPVITTTKTKPWHWLIVIALLLNAASVTWVFWPAPSPSLPALSEHHQAQQMPIAMNTAQTQQKPIAMNAAQTPQIPITMNTAQTPIAMNATKSPLQTVLSPTHPQQHTNCKPASAECITISGLPGKTPQPVANALAIAASIPHIDAISTVKPSKSHLHTKNPKHIDLNVQVKPQQHRLPAKEIVQPEIKVAIIPQAKPSKPRLPDKATVQPETNIAIIPKAKPSKSRLPAKATVQPETNIAIIPKAQPSKARLPAKATVQPEASIAIIPKAQPSKARLPAKAIELPKANIAIIHQAQPSKPHLPAKAKIYSDTTTAIITPTKASKPERPTKTTVHPDTNIAKSSEIKPSKPNRPTKTPMHIATKPVSIPPVEPLITYPTLRQKTREFRKSLPYMAINIHLYDNNKDARFVMINMKKYHEGDLVEDEVNLHTITPDGLVLGFHGERFFLPR